jgi:hypothetical protein
MKEKDEGRNLKEGIIILEKTVIRPTEGLLQTVGEFCLT